MQHQVLQGAGAVSHAEIDRRLPTDAEKVILAGVAGAPEEVEGARDDPEGALANLLAALEALGLITDSTTAS